MPFFSHRRIFISVLFNCYISTSDFILPQQKKNARKHLQLVVVTPKKENGKENKNNSNFESQSQLKAYLVIYYGKIIAVICAIIKCLGTLWTTKHNEIRKINAILCTR